MLSRAKNLGEEMCSGFKMYFLCACNPHCAIVYVYIYIYVNVHVQMGM